MVRRFSREPVVARSLKHSVRDGAAYSVMAGSGESYFSAFAVLLKATTAQIGFLASVPPLLASFMQLLSAWLGHLTGKRKAIILAGALLQGLVWLPMAWLAWWLPGYALEIFIGCVILYYAFGNLAVPQWASLMGDLVAERKRGRYFALRTRVSSISSFIALVAAGFMLHYFDGRGQAALGFVLIFAVAFVARLVSVYHLYRMYDPPGHVAAMELPVQKSLWQKLRHSQFARFSLFFALIQLSVAVGSPFFAIYLLRDLQFTYIEFMICTAASVALQFLTLTRWGNISDVFGNRVILKFCGMLIPLIPLLWLFSPNFYYLLLVQAFGGIIWAGFTLSASNFLYELIPVGKRATYMAMHNVLASIGIFIGAMLGGYLGTVLPQSFSLLGMDFHWLSALYNVFLLSFVLRLLTAWLFLPRIREARRVRPLRLRRLVFRIGRFNPLSGLFFDVVGSRRKDAQDVQNAREPLER